MQTFKKGNAVHFVNLHRMEITDDMTSLNFLASNFEVMYALYIRLFYMMITNERFFFSKSEQENSIFETFHAPLLDVSGTHGLPEEVIVFPTQITDAFERYIQELF